MSGADLGAEDAGVVDLRAGGDRQQHHYPDVGEPDGRAGPLPALQGRAMDCPQGLVGCEPVGFGLPAGADARQEAVGSAASHASTSSGVAATVCSGRL